MQTYDKARNALALALSPVVKALVDSVRMISYFLVCFNINPCSYKLLSYLKLHFFLQISFSDWFLSKGGTRTSIQRMWDPVAYALLRMLKGSPDVYLSAPIRKHITDKGGR